MARSGEWESFCFEWAVLDSVGTHVDCACRSALQFRDWTTFMNCQGEAFG
jgi:hypothetical protein